MTSTCPGELLRLELVVEQDVYLVRQRGREVAALVGLENQDQVRVATALSELARELIVLDSPATVTLSLAGDAPPVLLVTATWVGMVPGVASAAKLAAVEGIAAAARLTDTCEVRYDLDGGSVSLTKRLPISAPSPTATRIAELREACRNARPTSVQHIPEELRATILVVDDTAASRYISGSWLRRSGHRVIEAATGTEALAALAATEVDLVLLDVGLPDMSGFDVCERIKSDPALARPVIHLSATAIRGADRAQGLTRGADAYLTEPVEPDELLATVTWPWCSPPASAAASGGCSHRRPLTARSKLCCTARARRCLSRWHPSSCATR